MSNDQRTPISRVLPLAAQRAALLEIEQRGYALPCHVTAVNGQIVTVAFDVTGALIPPCTMAIAGAEYIRFPTQVGDKGVAEPASVDIGIVTGLGPANSLPNFRVRPGNLSALIFKPVGNANWTPSPNPNALVLYGPDGVIIQDKDGSSPEARITVQSGAIQAIANAVEIDSDVGVTGSVMVGTGASGTFTTPTGQTVTVQDGIVTNIF
jgi:hypothetical protein